MKDNYDNNAKNNHTSFVINAGGSPSIQEGPYIKRPAPNTKGRLFLDTDNNILYRDTGMRWIPLQLGPQGPQGPQGYKGSRGFTGFQGSQGPQGLTGATGPGFPPIAPSNSQTVYVNKGGNDITGDGTINNPYATILKAMTTILDASPTKRYAIIVGPGNYGENLSLKANVMIIGEDRVVVRIGTSGSFININDPTWSVIGDNRSGFDNVTLIASTLTFDFTAQSSVQGKLYFYSINCNNTPLFTAYNDINQVFIQNCVLFAGYTQTGINMLLANTSFINGGLITVNSSTLTNTSVQAAGGSTDGSLTATYTSGTAIDISLLGFTILGTLSAAGSCNVIAAANSIPIVTNLTGGASLAFINNAHALGYTPANSTNWHLPVPTTVQEALDQLASRTP
jgi:hypothetical protein